jgi:hypothetical protein
MALDGEDEYWKSNETKHAVYSGGDDSKFGG